MSFSDSDFTDIEEDEFQSNGKSKRGSGSQYKIRNALKVPRATTYTAQALYDQIHSSDIDLEPEYQRDVVWSETKQIGIIDSIFRNFYIPPVIFAVKVHDDGSEMRTCIDGKQRLTSIHRFMDGLIPHRDPFTNEKLWYKDSGKTKARRKLLPEKYRRLFAYKQIVCVEYQDITDSDEREIFQRVQLGMALTPAEKLQVSSGSRASFVRDLQNTYLKEGALVEDALDWDKSRGSDFRCLAQSLYTINLYPGSSSGTMPQIEKWLNNPEELDDSFKEHIHDTFRVFVQLVQDPKLNLVFNKPTRVSPIEFIMIVLLIATHKDKISLSQLSAAINGMRTNVRQEHVDIRMNGRVAKTMVEFIKGLKPKTDGPPAGGLKRKRGDDLEQSRPIKKLTLKVPKPPPSAPKQEARSGSFTSIPAPTPAPPASMPVSSIPDRLAALRAAKLLSGSSRPTPTGPRVLNPAVPIPPLATPQSSRDLENVLMQQMFPDMPPPEQDTKLSSSSRSEQYQQRVWGALQEPRRDYG